MAAEGNLLLTKEAELNFSASELTSLFSKIDGVPLIKHLSQMHNL